MSIGALANKWEEKRSQVRNRINRRYRVKLSVDGFSKTYELKIWERASGSLSLLVKKKSPVLSQVKVGKKIQIMYQPDNATYPVIFIRAKIRHITKRENGRYLIGLETLERKHHDSKNEVTYSLPDNGGRRSGVDRRRFAYTAHIPERRHEEDRRVKKDRRKQKIEKMNNLFERRSEYLFLQNEQ